MAPRLIAWNYATSWMLPDLIACLPLDYALDSSANGGELSRLARLPRAIRLVRLLRLVKLFRFQGWQKKLMRAMAGECSIINVAHASAYSSTSAPLHTAVSLIGSPVYFTPQFTHFTNAPRPPCRAHPPCLPPHVHHLLLGVLDPTHGRGPVVLHRCVAR